MPKIIWEAVGEKTYETGVDRGVLYPAVAGAYPAGVAWNGLTAVTEKPSGAEATPIYADNIKYLNLISAETFEGTIEAYTYPDEFSACNGEAELAAGAIIGQQARSTYGLCYRTVYGNDTSGDAHGYKLHLVYGCLATPSEKAYATVNDSPEAVAFSWDFTTTPVPVTGFKPTALLVIDSTTIDPAKLTALEDLLYGTEAASSRLPLPDEIKTLITTV